jgi:hypothetical protein
MLKAVINSPIRSGDQTINNGNLVVGTSGKGVDFSANTHAAGMTSEVFTWYEEGTWTPTLSGSTGDPTDVVYTSQVGQYTRVGRLVTVSALMGFSTYTGGSGVLRIAGLPFPVNASQAGLGACSIEQITIAAGYSFAVARARSNSSVIDILQSGSAVNWSGIALANAASSATAKLIQFTITYEV